MQEDSSYSHLQSARGFTRCLYVLRDQMTFVISATLEGIASEDLSLDGGRTLVQFLANEVYHYVENALHVLVSQSVEPVRIFQSKSEVILVHDLLFGLHIDGLLHVAHDFFKIKGFFFLFISPFEAFAFVLIFSINCGFQYFLNFKFETNLILSIQYSLIKSWRRRNLAYSCPSRMLFPKHSHKGISSNIKAPHLLLSKFLKSIICTFIPLYLIPISEIFFVWEL